MNTQPKLPFCGLPYYLREFFLLNYSTPDACRQAIAWDIDGTAGGTTAVYLAQISRRETNLKLFLFFAPICLVLLACIRLLVLSPATVSAREIVLDICALGYVFLFYRFTFINYYFQTTEVLSSTRRLLLSEYKIEERKASTLVAEISRRETSEDETAEEGGRKGAVTMLLLDQLVRKECNRPNIFNGDLETTSSFYIHIMNCQRKYFVNKAKYYRKRETILINSENARSTHIKYLGIIIDHYKAIEEVQFHLQAEELKAYLLKK